MSNQKKLKDIFSNQQSVYKVLETSPRKLNFFLSKLPKEKLYTTFQIPKKSGGNREISAPCKYLKSIQKKLAQLLAQNYRPPTCSYAYHTGRDCRAMASQHIGREWVIRIDLVDFFFNINFGRVRGIFQSKFFNLDGKTATMLARIVTLENGLPQGAPTSPILSNLAAFQLDKAMLTFANKNQLWYSRYADDLIFSTRNVPSALGELSGDRKSIALSEELQEKIVKAGFKINHSKTTVRNNKNQRQLVGGIVVNKKLSLPREYKREIRVMLHKWEKLGVDEASKLYFSKFPRLNIPHKRKPTYEEVLNGKIAYLEHIKRDEKSVYTKRFRRKFQILSGKRIAQPIYPSRDSKLVNVYVEGPTDIVHLDTAFQMRKATLGLDWLNLNFLLPNEKQTGDDALLKFLATSKVMPNHGTIICLFDADVLTTFRKIQQDDKPYRSWGNQVYSIILPKPKFVQSDRYCIEHMYPADIAAKFSLNNRRLFYREEFDANGFHLQKSNLVNPNFKSDKVILETVLDTDSKSNIALSKMDFAEKVSVEGQSIDFQGFDEIFNSIVGILEESEGFVHTQQTLRSI